MKWFQLNYKSLAIIIVLQIVLVVTGCSNASQFDQQDSIELSEVVGDKIKIQICNEIIYLPKKPITMIQSFLYKNPPGYQAVQVSLLPVDKVSIIFNISDVNGQSYDVFAPLATAEIYCDGSRDDESHSFRNLKLIKTTNLTEIGLNEYREINPRSNIDYAYFMPINTVKSSDWFDLRCEPSNSVNHDFSSCVIAGHPRQGVRVKIRFNDIRDWREYSEVLGNIIYFEEK